MRLRSGLPRKILEALADGAINTTALILAITTSGYGASTRKLMKNQEQIEKEIENLLSSSGSPSRRQYFHTVMYRLKRDGLIEQKEGKWHLKEIARAKIISQLLPRENYQKEKDDTLKIVIFDIPEKFRRKRDWIRERLREIGLEMLQKSVWAGKVRIPKEFIEHLRDLRLLDYVDIFAVSKTGTLRAL